MLVKEKPSRFIMSGRDGKTTSRISSSSSRGLNSPSETFSGLRTASTYAMSGSIKGRSKKGLKNRKPSRAFRKRTIEVIDLSSDDENGSDIEFLEEVIDISGGDNGDRKILEPIVKGQGGVSSSDTGANSEETNYPGSSSSNANGDNPFADISLDSISPLPFSSPISSPRSMSPHENVGSGEADLLVSYESDNGDSEVGSSEEMVIEITPLLFEDNDLNRGSQSEAEVPSAIVYEDQMVPVDPEDQKVSPILADQEVPIVPEDQDGVDDDAGRNESVSEREVPSYRQGDDSVQRFAEEDKEVARLDDSSPSLDDQCVPEEELSANHAMLPHGVEDTMHPPSDD